MPKIIKFKHEGASLNIGGRVIRQHDMNEQVYDELVKIAPAHADLFDVTEAPAEVKETKSSKEAKTV
jgi:hypothetical protein